MSFIFRFIFRFHSSRLCKSVCVIFIFKHSFRINVITDTPTVHVYNYYISCILRFLIYVYIFISVRQHTASYIYIYHMYHHISELFSIITTTYIVQYTQSRTFKSISFDTWRGRGKSAHTLRDLKAQRIKFPFFFFGFIAVAVICIRGCGFATRRQMSFPPALNTAPAVVFLGIYSSLVFRAPVMKLRSGEGFRRYLSACAIFYSEEKSDRTFHIYRRKIYPLFLSPIYIWISNRIARSIIYM